MAYKTVLVHVDQSRRVAERVRIAAQIALDEDAHLVGVAMTGIAPADEAGVDADLVAPGAEERRQGARRGAMEALAAFETQVSGTDISRYDMRLVEDEAWSGLILQARYSDLLVLSQADPGGPLKRIKDTVPDKVVVHCPRPVLLIPAAEYSWLGIRRAMIAWNASLEAARAVAHAIPMLQRAQHVDVAIFDAHRDRAAHGGEPGAELGRYLGRHGIGVEIKHQSAGADAGEAIMKTALDWRSDLVVMGAYGRSRFREMLLGGATRSALDSMTVPVLMSR